MLNKIFWTLSLSIAMGLIIAEAQSQIRDGGGELSLKVKVVDTNGDILTAARVQLKSARGFERTLETNDRGESLFSKLSSGEYQLHVEADGFSPFDMNQIVLTGTLKIIGVRLEVAALEESVAVAQDKQEEMTDPQGTAFTTVLTEQQIAQLPDDPEEFAATIREMAGPGAIIRVNGFSGGRLPPKSQIREIRFRLNPYAAENHEAGLVSVDIYTKPGTNNWGGSFDFGFRDESLGARNAFAPQRGAEQYRRFGLSLEGPLTPKRTSLFMSAEGSLSFDSKTIVVALPEGAFTSLVRAPSRNLNLAARVEHTLTKYHTLHVEYQRNAIRQNNLGVGNFDLPERAFSLRNVENLFRVSDTGLLFRRFVNEVRFESRWQEIESRAANDSPAVLVLNSFNSGGAQVQSLRRAFELEIANNVDFGFARHALKAGVLLEAGSYTSNELRNANGTFTFASIEAFRNSRPITFSRRVGDPVVSFTQYQFGWFLQDDFRLRKDLTLSFGLRHEMQNHIGDFSNFAPRFGLAWSPSKDAKTTLRMGAGIFYDWFGANVFEQILRVDGQRQRDVIVRNAGFPDPFINDVGVVLPPSRFQLAQEISMPYIGQASVGVERQLSDKLTLKFNYFYQQGARLLRGHNVNAPFAGTGRPNPNAGNINQIESSAKSTLNQINVNLSPGQTLSLRRLYWLVNYSWSKATNVSDGPFNLPSDNFDLAADRGPSLLDARHRLFAIVNFTIFRELRLGTTFRASSALPYNVTTGFDDNGDTVVNDRPLGVTRNSARGATHWEQNARLSWTFGFGERAASQTGTPSVIRSRSDADTLGALSSRGGSSRWRGQLYIQGFNLLNRVNLTNFTGVQTSPFFGRATAALSGRRIETGIKFSF